MAAPPVHDLEGAFHTMVVSEASTSPAAFSRSAVAAEAAHEEPPAVGAVDQGEAGVPVPACAGSGATSTTSDGA